MSELLAAEILIGGRIAANVLPELCDAISIEDVSLEWGDATFQPETATDLLANRIDHDGSQVLRLRDDQARWGRFEQLEAFLEQHRIAFDRFSDGKYEYDPEWVAFRPGGNPVVIAIDASREPTVAAGVLSEAMGQVTSAIKELDQGEARQALAVLRSLQEALSSEIPKIPATLPSLEIETEPALGEDASAPS